MLFWAAAPTLIARYTYNQAAVERIENLWRVHENRQKRGLGGTVSGTGHHESLQQDSNFRLNNGIHVRFDTISHGIRSKPYLNSPFTRFHETIEDYSDFHDDIDDHDLYEIDNWERMKPFSAKTKDVVGNSTVIPMDDNDETLKFYDVQGESLYTNPPNPNMPTVDHGLDEDHPWAFRMTGNNQSAVFNQYTRNLNKATQMSHVPMWGKKLAAPVFYRDDKYAKFFKHWGHRLGLEQIKMRHVIQGSATDPQVRRQQKKEIQQYLAKVQAEIAAEDMHDVFITNHKADTPRYLTLNEDEDLHFQEYMASLQTYKEKPVAKRVSQYESGRYERGSLAQRLFEPLAGAHRNEQGALEVSISDKDLRTYLDTDKMRRQFERASNTDEMPGSEEEQEELRVALLDEINAQGLDTESWDAILDKELSVFKQGEKYSYVKDMREGFDQGVSTTTVEKIFQTLPAHVFWDIKKPLSGEYETYMNPYNPARKYHGESFFDIRNTDQWMHDRAVNDKLKSNISRYRRY